MDFSAGAFNRAEQLPVGGQQDQGREGFKERGEKVKGRPLRRGKGNINISRKWV